MARSILHPGLVAFLEPPPSHPIISFLMRSIGSIETLCTQDLHRPNLAGWCVRIDWKTPTRRLGSRLEQAQSILICLPHHHHHPNHPTFLPDADIYPTSPTPQAIDLEPIDFEHFLDEPDLERSHHLEKMFRFSQTPDFFISSYPGVICFSLFQFNSNLLTHFEF